MSATPVEPVCIAVVGGGHAHAADIELAGLVGAHLGVAGVAILDGIQDVTRAAVEAARNHGGLVVDGRPADAVIEIEDGIQGAETAEEAVEAALDLARRRRGEL